MAEDHIRWVIVGRNGLYVGQTLTRYDAIAEHVEALHGARNTTHLRKTLSTAQADAWRKCKANGDRAVKAVITVY